MTTGRSEKDTAEKLVRLLDRGAASVPAGVAYRLQAARQQALARLTSESATGAASGTLNARGGTRSLWGAGGGGGFLQSARFWVAALVLAGALAYALHWQDARQESELAEIDTSLLASDLPVDAFIDKGFQNWIRRGEQP